jgi:hypothetical protein
VAPGDGLRLPTWPTWQPAGMPAPSTAGDQPLWPQSASCWTVGVADRRRVGRGLVCFRTAVATVDRRSRAWPVCVSLHRCTGDMAARSSDAALVGSSSDRCGRVSDGVRRPPRGPHRAAPTTTVRAATQAVLGVVALGADQRPAWIRWLPLAAAAAAVPATANLRSLDGSDNLSYYGMAVVPGRDAVSTPVRRAAAGVLHGFPRRRGRR